MYCISPHFFVISRCFVGSVRHGGMNRYIQFKRPKEFEVASTRGLKLIFRFCHSGKPLPQQEKTRVSEGTILAWHSKRE